MYLVVPGLHLEKQMYLMSELLVPVEKVSALKAAKDKQELNSKIMQASQMSKTII